MSEVLIEQNNWKSVKEIKIKQQNRDTFLDTLTCADKNRVKNEELQTSGSMTKE